ncbi:hypothetical protein SUGI_0682800 [Cryptomeria japonica]|nr:hypothetical protein SUGI_0682800 [Cryptomeria japonica]
MVLTCRSRIGRHKGLGYAVPFKGLHSQCPKAAGVYGNDPDDGSYWLDLPKDGSYLLDLPKDGAAASRVKQGDLQNTEAYVHIKPMLGGSCNDIAMRLFYPSNSPRSLKVQLFYNSSLGKIGQRVHDWEHTICKSVL